MHDFLIAFIGGLMLGLSVVGYLYVNGRIAGISGLIGQVLNSKPCLKHLQSGFYQA
jgi:fatty acid-binding protein DegV